MKPDASDSRSILIRLISICSADGDAHESDLDALRLLQERKFDWIAELRNDLTEADEALESVSNEVRALGNRDIYKEWIDRTPYATTRSFPPLEVQVWIDTVNDLKRRVTSCKERRKSAIHAVQIGSQLEALLDRLVKATTRRRLEQLERERVARKQKQEAHKRDLLRMQVIELLRSGALDEASELYQASCVDWWPQKDFESVRDGEHFTGIALRCFESGSLSSLDDLYWRRPSGVEITSQDWSAVKQPKLQARLRSMAFGPLDTQQILAIGRPDTRLIIQARAGSGKTRTICARAALAIRDEGLSPDQVLILAFNKAAAEEVKRRVRTMGRIENYENARTFHSLAYQLAKPNRSLLFDDSGHPNAREQSRFVQRLLQRVMNPAFKEAMVEFFRKELEQIENIGRDLAPPDYLIFRRSLEQITLGGQRVKSTGEKFIADFLFEHGVDFRYERAWEWKTDFLDGAAYRPDFSILANGRDIILEHWAIDPNDPMSEVPANWDITTDRYRSQIVAKRAFWRSKGVPLIETHSGQSRSRADFEKLLAITMERAGIACRRLPHDEIVRRVFENDFTISRIAELFLQFIQRAKKRAWTPDELSQRIQASPDSQPRARMFHDLALRVYREYEALLNEESAMDFDDLLLAATKEVESRGGTATIHLGEGRTVALDDIRWILLDEFQDFSELYLRMLSAILRATPSARLVAVGDDWQAINGFAGAELRFFEGFSEYFPGASIAGVTTNYRSDRAVVGAGNNLMRGRGQPARASRSTEGQIEVKYLNDTWIEFRQGESNRESREADAIYLTPAIDGQSPSNRDLRLAQALKCCAEIIVDAPDRKTLLLARTNMLYGLELAGFRRRLVEVLVAKTGKASDEIGHSLSAITAHGSKGQEAARVIILDATMKQFPKVHPDNLLFEPFGILPQDVLDEERRLFYVAITRAEHELFVLTEKDTESPYLEAASLTGQGGVGESSSAPAAFPQGELARKLRAKIDQLGVLEADSGPWAEIRFQASTTISSIVLDLQTAGVPVPKVSFKWPDGRLNAIAELAWPDSNPPVAILVGDQFRFRPQWLGRGWKVPPHDLPPNRVVEGVKRYVGCT